MNEISNGFVLAGQLIFEFDPALVEIVLRSLQVSVIAVALASFIGLPLGAALATLRFPGRGLVIVGLNALMGLPPVVVGLVVYLVLSRSGPLGTLGLLFTPTAMIVAQTLLVLPIVASLSLQTSSDLFQEYREYLTSLGLGPLRSVPALLWDGHLTLTTVVLAGFGRAIAEVGAVMIVGGNIDHATRVMTTTIALETSKGNLALALALGLILIAISVSVTAAASIIKTATAKVAG